MAKKISLRQCVGCGEMKDKKEMMRVLKSADGPILLDMSGRKNGRGRLPLQRQGVSFEGEKEQGTGTFFQDVHT